MSTQEVLIPGNPELITPAIADVSEALTVIESKTAALLFAGAVDPIVAAIAKHARAEAAKLDVAKDADRKALASLAYKVAKAKNVIDKKRLDLVRDEKERLKKIDREGARIWDELEALQAEVRKPLTEWEQAEKERIAKLEAAIAEIEGAGPHALQNWQTLSIECMSDRRAEIQNDNRDWQDFKNRAQLARETTIRQIGEAIAKREKYDSEQAELARLRAEAAERAEKERQEAAAREQKEREERIAREAKEKAEREAREREEKLAREKQEAEARALKAEADRKAAEEKAIRDAEEAARVAEQNRLKAIDDERKRVAAAEEAERQASERRENNKRHVAKVNREAAAAFLKIGFDQAAADAIVNLIAEGKVPNVRISY